MNGESNRFLTVLRNMWRIPDLRNRLLFTLGIFAVYRLGATLPAPGIDVDALQQLADQPVGIAGLINLFSGGSLTNGAVLALGVMPYITSSIIMQLLTTVVPRLEKLQEEGESGRRRITQYTRYLTVAIALLQAFVVTTLLRNGSLTGGINVITQWSPGRAILIAATLTAGTALIMWMGELITQRGVGNGMSLLIFISIVSQLPAQLNLAWQTSDPKVEFAVLATAFVAMMVGIIYVEQAQRRIPIQFARRMRGRRVLGGQATYIPLKVNNAGVVPIIFATSVLYFPFLLATLVPFTGGFWTSVRDFLNEFAGGSASGLGASAAVSAGARTWVQILYIVVLFLLILFFAYFYTEIQFNPERQAESIQRNGGFIPGIRPGSETAGHLRHVLSRITLPGASFLALVAILPNIISTVFDVSFAFGGISILIVVGVALETMKQIESQLTMRNYEGFLA